MAAPAPATAPARETGAERLLRAAAESGMDTCFANPGTSEMHAVAALDSAGGTLRPVLGLHETVCSGAADGFGRMVRRPALVLLHVGPGLANALANLHNARRASTPMVVLVGDMATWHKGADALLDSDVAALARTVSCSVVQPQPGDDLGATMRAAVAEACAGAAPGASRVVTLVVPHDMCWASAPLPSSNTSSGSEAAQARAPTYGHGPLSDVAARFVRDAAAALRACPRGQAAVYVGGCAALEDDDALLSCGRIAAATGATLWCENAFARVDRGAGRPALRRLPYFAQDAAAALAQYRLLLLVGARRPVAMFGYEGGSSQLVNLPDDAVWEFDSGELHLPSALRLLAAEVGGAGIQPGVNCRGAFCSPSRPQLPSGPLTAAGLCQVVAALQPEGTILVDESITSGGAYWDASAGCPPFTHLTLTGGAIGAGIPLAVGAALACPTRPVIALQADGSGLYSVQGLWTQARQQLHVVTLICANRAYGILKLELAKQRITPATGPAVRALTQLSPPTIDWVALAQGLGVPGSRARTCEELGGQLRAALDRPGPSLVEAVL